MYKKILMFFLLFLFFLAADYLLLYAYDMYTSQKQTHLLEHLPLPEVSLTTEEIPMGVVKTERMLQVETLQQENPDIIGWIEIEGTQIHYPVLQGVDNTYYMNHTYQKKYSAGGSIFLDANYHWNPPDDNILLYGHNMKNGSMFQNLVLYENKSYWEKHPRIRFTTTTEDSEYAIFSILKSRIYYRDEQNVFRYYYFLDASTEADFTSFVENAKKESLYDTGITASYGDRLLTLSTCAYHTQDGRFVVIAKKINL